MSVPPPSMSTWIRTWISTIEAAACLAVLVSASETT
jgi:hypothetical protein